MTSRNKDGGPHAELPGMFVRELQLVPNRKNPSRHQKVFLHLFSSSSENRMIRFQTFFFRLHLFRVFFRWRVPRLISAATTKTTTSTLTAAATATTTSTRAALEVLNSSISLVCLLFQLAHTIFDSASDWKWFFAAAAVYSRFFSLAASKWFFSLSMCGCLVQHYFAKKKLFCCNIFS